MPQSYAPQFRSRQDKIDRGEITGGSNRETAELRAALRRIASSWHWNRAGRKGRVGTLGKCTRHAREQKG
jgi:hypothetical protein